tara:strand:- start:195 stop:587 length:393 start_codon:yes stop_codon:yes gene_type:complete
MFYNMDEKKLQMYMKMILQGNIPFAPPKSPEWEMAEKTIFKQQEGEKKNLDLKLDTEQLTNKADSLFKVVTNELKKINIDNGGCFPGKIDIKDGTRFPGGCFPSTKSTKPLGGIIIAKKRGGAVGRNGVL